MYEKASFEAISCMFVIISLYNTYERETLIDKPSIVCRDGSILLTEKWKNRRRRPFVVASRKMYVAEFSRKINKYEKTRTQKAQVFFPALFFGLK